ncbi:MAG: HNH endonuclease, partial [Candidatus Hodarchaeota archaeon]
ECHHIIPRTEDGTDVPQNLIVLCQTCHAQVHTGSKRLSIRTIKASIHRNIQATQMNVLRSQLKHQFPQAQETLGCITKIDQERLTFSNYFDAVVIASRRKNVTFKQSSVFFKRCVPDEDYQQRKGKRSDRPVPRVKIHGFKKYDKVRYQGREYFIKGRMSTGYAVLMDIFGAKTVFDHTPKMSRMVRLTARKSYLIVSHHLEDRLPTDSSLP